MIFGFLTLIFVFGGLDPVHATDPNTVSYQVSVAPSLLVEVPTGNNVTLNLNPNSKTFDYRDMEVVVRTNNITGYQLKLATADNNTYLSRDTSSDVTPINARMDTLATSASGYSDSAFENCAISDCMNKWGYKVTASDTDPSLVTSNYFPFVNNITLATNHQATNGDSTTMRFAAKIDWDQIAGTYENTLVFTAVATYAAYTINYYDGVDNTAGNEIATQTDAYNTSSSIPISPTYTGGATAPTRSGNAGNTYVFAGWCKSSTNTVPVNTTTEYNTSTKIYSNPATKCNGTSYQNGDTLTINPDEYDTNITLYAYWTPTTFADAGVTASTTMQNSNMSTICANVTPNQWTTMIDSRDSQSYHVGKLEDNRCWMLDNLNFDAYTYKNNITTANTHASGTVGSTALNAFKNGGGTGSDRYATSAINSASGKATSGNWTASWSYSDPLINKSGKCDPTTNTSYQCLSPYQNANYTSNTVINKYGTPASDSSGTASTTYNIGPGNYKLGIYYNFCAATLGAYCYGNVSTEGSPSGDATEADICPYNWRLPTGGLNGEYQILYNKLSSISASPQTSTNSLSFQAMLSTPMSGGYISSTALWQGAWGRFWTSAYSASTNMFYGRVSGTAVTLQNSNNRNNGLSVRCIAQ